LANYIAAVGLALIAAALTVAAVRFIRDRWRKR
jgi:hypothetical protein